MTQPGRHADGGGLYLAISKSGSQHWVFFTRQGRQREDARDKAAEFRSLLAKDIDPIVQRQAVKPSTNRHTFGECAEALIKAKRPTWRSAHHANQWAAH